jgi:hypothetical protein
MRFDARDHHAEGITFFPLSVVESELAYPKYPPQPIVRCDGYQRKKKDDELKQ